MQRGYTPDVAGANLNETQLTPNNISGTTFGRLFSLPVDGAVYAQPLYVSNLSINGFAHNVVFVATMKNMVYAFDAGSGDLLWQVNYSNTVPGATAVPISYNPNLDSNITGWIGIEGTPVIDVKNKTMYFVTNTLENSQRVFRLHAVNITSGVEKFGGPVVINPSFSFNGNSISFDANQHNHRTSLTLANNQVIVSFAGHEDRGNYYGWTLSYEAKTLTQTGVFNPAPANYGGGIWQSGRPPAVDSLGYVYLFTGNGFSYFGVPTADGTNNFAESVVKLDPVSLQVIDYFTPANFQTLDINDLDLSSSGPSLIPNTNVLIGGGKTGNLYLLDQLNLGQMQANDTGALQNVQATASEIRSGPVIWARSNAYGGPLVYLWASWDVLNVFSFDTKTKRLNPTPVSSFTHAPWLYPGGTLALSANGDQNGILWAAINSQGNPDTNLTPGELQALNASDVTQSLWNSNVMPARDGFGLLNKFTPPLVANGKVFMATASNQVLVYGLYPSANAITVTAWPAQQTTLGGMASYRLATFDTTGANIPVSYSLSGLPSGAVGQFTTDGHGNNVLQVVPGQSTAEGSYAITVTATAAATGSTATQALLMIVQNSSRTDIASASADSESTTNPASMAIDGGFSTFWESVTAPTPAPYPHNFVLNLGSVQPVTGIQYIPRQDGCVDGTLSQYEIAFSNDNVNWKTFASEGAFDYSGDWRNFACDGQTYPQSQKVAFPAINAQYVSLQFASGIIDASPLASAAEFKAYVSNDNAPQVALTSSLSSITPGQSVILTATVTGNSPTGVVQFLNNNTNLDSPVTLVNGVATLTTTSLTSVGADAITANYQGDANNYANTSAAININVLSATSISISSSATSFAAGSSVTLTATVSGAYPTGTVQFYLNGAALDQPVTLANGSAILTTTDITNIGSDNITASYSGDNNNIASNSNTPLVETVTPVSQAVPALPWIFELILGLGLARALLMRKLS